MLPAWSDVVQRRRRGRLGAGAFAVFVAQRQRDATGTASDETKSAPQEQPIDEKAAEKPRDEKLPATNDDPVDAWEPELASYAQQRLEALRAVVRAKAPRLGGHIGRAITRAIWSFAAPVLAAYRPAHIFDARRSLEEDSNRLAYGFGVAVDDSDDDPERFVVYVADVSSAVIVRFRGDHVDILGKGALARPYDVVATRSGTLYVADRDANAIVRVGLERVVRVQAELVVRRALARGPQELRELVRRRARILGLAVARHLARDDGLHDRAEHRGVVLEQLLPREQRGQLAHGLRELRRVAVGLRRIPVSYTHLTLPTILLV